MKRRSSQEQNQDSYLRGGGEGPKLKTKKKIMKIKTNIYFIFNKILHTKNKYFLNISYYKTHQQSITYKISVFYFVRDFLLVHIYLFILFFVVKGV